MSLTGNKIKSLQKKSQDELNIFTGTVKRLSKINVDIRIEKKKRNELIAKLKEEVLELGSTEVKNDRLVAKIQDFLN